MRSHPKFSLALGLAGGLFLGAWPRGSSAATITIVNQDGVNEGFNDPTPAAPVGGNPGTTIGAQRLYVFQYAAAIWGGILPSSVEIRIDASFDPNPLNCTATSGVLGSAGPISVVRDFTNAPFTGTWYHVALANRLAGSDFAPSSDDIVSHFNSSVGGANCLPEGWYYGVDGNEGTKIELLPVVLHEFGHGLGFSTLTDAGTNTNTGAYFGTPPPGFPCAYDHFLFDDTQGLLWTQMTAGQRAASAINCQKLAWNGALVTAHAHDFLGPKTVLHVNTPPAIAGDYNVGLADFGPPLNTTGVTGGVVLVNDGVGTTSNGCEPLVNGAQVNGKIALIDRGACTFVTKVKNAQNAGAIGVIVADSVAGCPAVGMGGIDATITIPSVRVTQADGTTLKSQLGTENATLHVAPAVTAGLDAGGRVLVYTPNPVQPGSSVSHWDTSCEPSLLMEPAITDGLSSNVDLTRQFMGDIGWFQGLLAVDAAARQTYGLGPSVPNPSAGSPSIHFTLARDDRVELGIYDLAGRLVARPVSGPLPQGEHTVKWDGTDLAGRPVSAGVYLYRLKTRSFSAARHLVLVR